MKKFIKKFVKTQCTIFVLISDLCGWCTSCRRRTTTRPSSLDTRDFHSHYNHAVPDNLAICSIYFVHTGCCNFWPLRFGINQGRRKSKDCCLRSLGELKTHPALPHDGHKVRAYLSPNYFPKIAPVGRQSASQSKQLE